MYTQMNWVKLYITMLFIGDLSVYENLMCIFIDKYFALFNLTEENSKKGEFYWVVACQWGKKSIISYTISNIPVHIIDHIKYFKIFFLH